MIHAALGRVGDEFLGPCAPRARTIRCVLVLIEAVVDAALTEIGPPSADAELYLCVCTNNSPKGIQCWRTAVRGSLTSRASTAHAPRTGAWSEVPLRYVLLSYPLGVRWALTSFHGSFFQRALEQMVRKCAEGNTRVLLVTTTRDQFTSASVGCLCADTRHMHRGPNPSPLPMYWCARSTRTTSF